MKISLRRLRPRSLTFCLVLVFGLLGFSLLVGSQHVAADSSAWLPPGDNGYNCGVENQASGGVGQDTQQAAGLVVDMNWVPYGHGINDARAANNTQVQVTTFDDTGPLKPQPGPRNGNTNGAIAEMTADDSAEKSLNHRVVFNQVPANCHGEGNVMVLGYGTTSPNAGDGWSHWALDCEETIRSAAGFTGHSQYQPFEITGLGTPDGARPGGTWTDTLVNPANGHTQYITLTYQEPAPPTPNPPTAACTAITITDDGGYNVQGGNSNPRPTQTHVIVHGSVVEANDGTPSPGYGTDPGIDTVSNKNPIDNGQSRTWSNLQPISSVIYVQRIRQWKSTDGVWNNYSDTTQAIPCYSATCTINVDSKVPGDPNGVIANQPFTVSATIYAKGPDGSLSPSDLADSIEGNQLSINNGDVNGNGSAWGFSVPFSTITRGGFQTEPFTLIAPDDTSQHALWAHPAYSNLFAFGGGQCSLNINVYKHFTLQPTASSQLSPTKENPTTVNYPIGVSQQPDQYNGGIPATLTGTLYNQGGGAVASTSYSGTYGTVTYNNPPPTWPIPGTVQAGQQYCAQSVVNPGTGYWGPSGVFDGQPVSSPSSCDHVTNEPYFKVTGSGASAGMSVTPPNGQCTPSTNGLLAGWNNNADNQERGAGSQLSALALVKITGFASAQTNINRPATDLTFANNGPGVSKTTDSDSPDLGGSFSPSGYCISDVSPPPSNPNTQTLPGGASYGGNGNVIGNQSIFVNGDVTITNNVIYGNGWSFNNAPSMVLHATGNINIAPNVTELDGLYISDRNIYTCATSSGPVTRGSYDTCKNQLLVHGNFTANQVKLERTFGSLRDEEPVIGYQNVSNGDGSVQFSRFYCGVGRGYPSIHFYQAQSNPKQPASTPSDCSSDGDAGYILPTQTSGSVPLYYATKDGDNLYTTDYNQAKTFNGLVCVLVISNSCPAPVTAGFVQGRSGPGLQPLYGVYNPTTKYHFYTTSAAEYEAVKAAIGNGGLLKGGLLGGQTDLGIVAYVYNAAGLGGTTKSVPVSQTPPNPLVCSNRGTQTVRSTCAAEVFELSPELYLSNPNIHVNGGSNGNWDAITSLPPVL